MNSLRFAVAVVSLAALLRAGEARAACAQPRDEGLSPPDHAQQVPLNAELKLAWASYVPRLRPAGGDFVETQVVDAGALRSVRPRSPLQAGTRYEVVNAKGAVVASFTTGSAADETPPRYTAPAAATYEEQHDSFVKRLFGTSSDGNGVEAFALRSDPAADETHASGLYYLAYAGPDARSIDFSKPAYAQLGGPIEFLGRRGCLFHGEFGRQPAAVVLTVIDWAGNESARGAPLALTPSPGSGCGCSSAGPVEPLGLALALGRLRRRRPARSVTG